jgi:hypothetical protein
MKKIIIYICLLISFASVKATEFSVYEANYPNVKDYNVNINEATLVIRPVGDYVEFNLYMTVSYDFQSWFFKNYNELEFKWQFDLPEDAIVHEFWYWQGDSIITADILDKWTAELLFNNVSSPVRNPGLLTQSYANSDGQVTHELRLFPIKRNEQRRFKIQYLLPARPTGNSMRVWLPMSQLIAQNTPGIKQLKILYKYGSIPFEPKIIGTNVIQSKNNITTSDWEIVIPVESDQFVEMELPSPITKNIFMTTYSQENENFYHLAVYPPQIPKVATPRNVLFVIDFNRFNTNDLDGDFLLSYLKESVMQAFSESDSINVMVAYDQIISGGSNWIPCKKDSVDKLFQKIMMRSFPSYNNLLPLISRATDFINSHGSSAEVLSITNTNTINLGETDKIQLADDIVKKFKQGTKLHFIDLDNKGYLYYNNGFYETQMQSFYGRITYPSSGDLFFLRYNSLKEMLYSFLYEEISHYESIEVQMRFQEGYAHSKHLIASHEGYYPMNTPIMQVGKFSGQFPVEITVFGKYKTKTQNYSITINESDVVKGNNQIATAWYGGHIQSLLKLPYDPLTISDIIDLSLKQKILTPYSGFLVFNLDENHGYCSTCQDESGNKNTSVETSEADSTINLEVSVFPNPFNPTTTINYELPANGYVHVKVYNILGESVADLVNATETKGKHIVSFNGSKYASGIYILTISLESSKKNYFTSKKLLLMK